MTLDLFANPVAPPVAGIPNDYTGCERYYGYTIALRHGWYYAFSPNGSAPLAGSGFKDRAQCRRFIEADILSRDSDLDAHYQGEGFGS